MCSKAPRAAKRAYARRYGPICSAISRINVTRLEWRVKAYFLASTTSKTLVQWSVKVTFVDRVLTLGGGQGEDGGL